jgi:hypothetical protein
MEISLDEIGRAFNNPAPNPVARPSSEVPAIEGRRATG